MAKKPKTIEIGNMTYWSSGDDIGDCDGKYCNERAFSYNEDGDKFCEDCLIDWHEQEVRKASIPELEKQFRCDHCGTTYKTVGQADDCCSPHHSEVYVCPQCRNDYDEMEEAQMCCFEEL